MKLLRGDCLKRMAEIEAKSVQCCVTSPPYFGLRDYGNAAQIGLEPTPDEYVAKLVNVFREVRRVLRDDGTVWLNLGDSYAGGGPHHGIKSIGKSGSNRGSHQAVYHVPSLGLKPKDLIGIPWRVAFALQADGWYLRQDIIWSKQNPMPESVTDRCTKSHEYLFLLSKSRRYHYKSHAISEPAIHAGQTRTTTAKSFAGSAIGLGVKPTGNAIPGSIVRIKATRNRRSVWRINTTPFKGAHFAVMPEALVEPCILAGSRPGDTILDPFAGAGTVAVVAQRHGRHFVGVELNASYITIAKRRIREAQAKAAAVPA